MRLRTWLRLKTRIPQVKNRIPQSSIRKEHPVHHLLIMFNNEFFNENKNSHFLGLGSKIQFLSNVKSPEKFIMALNEGFFMVAVMTINKCIILEFGLENIA